MKQRDEGRNRGLNVEKFIRLLVACGLGVCAVASLPKTGWAQTGAEIAGPSYSDRWRVFKSGDGVKDVDPNVYVYTPEFAKRFQMPEEWISTDLKGADAVAYRVVPAYSTCGWGGDPKACRTDAVRCEMDLYFDHQRNPLPWDARYPEIRTSRYSTSAHFVPAPIRELRLPQRPDDHFFAKYSPFVNPKAGKGLWWQGGYWNSDTDRGGMYFGLISYDRETFVGVALVTMAGGCGEPADALWLTSDNHGYREKSQAYQQVTLPQTWRVRVKQALRESSERSEAFFKREGENAIKARRESPVPNRTIVPLQ